MSPSFGTLSSLKQRGFRFYLGIYLSQMAAGDMRTVAQSLLIYRLTGSVALLGVLSLVYAVPGILLPLVGGVIADRFPKKLVINLGQVGAILPSMLVAVSLSLGWLSAERVGSWWILMLATFINSCTFSLTTPARSSIISELVGTDHIMNAISLRSTSYNILHLAVPAVAGIIIDRFDFALVYYVMSFLSFIGLIFTLYLPHMDVKGGKGRNALSQLKDGFKYVRSETHIMFILAFTLVTAIMMMPYSRLMPVYVDDILKVGATGYGLLLSFSAVGGIVGSLVMASLPSRKRGIMLLVDVTVLGLALAGFAFSRNWHLSLAVIVLVGLAQPARTALCNSMVQSYTDHDYQGRVMSLYSLQDGVSSLGGFLAAMVAVAIGTPWTVGGFAIAMVLLSVSTMIFLPRIRKLE
jgi:MFS family permease